jgi:glycerol kinase
VSPVLEATTLGAGFLAGLAIGTYANEDEVADTFTPRRSIEPRTDDATRALVRERWLLARSKAEATIPELSGISF